MQFPSLRSRLTRFAAPAVLGVSLLGGALAQAPAAHADFTWCWDDPQIAINGHVMTILTGFQSDAATIRATVQRSNITVHIPKNLTAQVLTTTNTYVQENVTIVADLSTWTAGHDLQVKAEATFTRTAASAAAPKPVDFTTGMQVSADSGKTYLQQGHIHDNLHHDYTFHHDGATTQTG